MKLSYYGYFTPFGGYGIVNLNWVKHLRRLGVDVYPHRKFEVFPTTPEWEVLTPEEREIFSLPFEKQKVGIIETTPFDFGLIDTEIKIANTMCESSFISKEWVEPINRMDFVIVPNAWTREVFLESGVTKPIEVIPHGQDANLFKFKERVPGKHRTFRFGIVGYLNDRKGVFDLIQAFCSEFEKSEPVELYLKSSNKAFAYYSNFSDPRIITDCRHLSSPELVKLYHDFDCFVFPSKAEGVGNPPREALLTGCPVIVGNYSGLEEIAKPEYVYPIDPINFNKRADMVEQPGDWANYDIQELMYWMRWVYEHQEEANSKAEKGSRWLAEQFSWEKVTHQLVDFVRKFA